MDYEPIRAVKVFEAVLRGQGLDPATAGLAAAERERVADLVNESLARAWRYAMWPNLMRVARVAYRDEWSASTLYARDDEVMRRDADGNATYWRLAAATDTGTVPGTDAAVWAEPTDFLPGIRYCAHFVDELDLEAGVFEYNPELRLDPKAYRAARTAFGCVVKADADGHVPAEPWIRFRPNPPEFSWTDWDDEAEYAAGDCVFHEGVSYVALAADEGTEPGTDAAVWCAVPFPRMFLSFVVEHAAALRAQDDDGRAARLRRAEALLEELEERLVAQTRTRRRVAVRVC